MWNLGREDFPERILEKLVCLDVLDVTIFLSQDLTFSRSEIEVVVSKWQ